MIPWRATEETRQLHATRSGVGVGVGLLRAGQRRPDGDGLRVLAVEIGDEPWQQPGRFGEVVPELTT